MSDQPLVSCIMPTHNRRRFVPLAIDYFLQQDDPHRELIIIDDGSNDVRDLVPDDPRIRDLPLQRRHSIGAKGNLACRHAHGELIAHWDDDDSMAPWRLSYQGEQLLEQDADLCGVDQLFFYDPLLRRRRRAGRHTGSVLHGAGCGPLERAGPHAPRRAVPGPVDAGDRSTLTHNALS